MSATAPAATSAVVPADPRTAIQQARADVQRSAVQAELQGDPLGAVLDAFSASLGAMGTLLEHVEASRQPLDASARAAITRQLVQACRADFVRQAEIRSRRTAALSGVAAAVLLLGTLGGGFLWGRSVETAEVRAAAGVIRAALSDGSASATAWADAIRRNDLPRLLARCEGGSVWADASGRRACAVPLWLDDVPVQAMPPAPKS